MLMTFISWIIWFILGAIAGAIASRIERRRYAPMTNIIIGILGALIGGVIFSLLGLPTITDFNPLSMIGALVGAVVLLLIVHALYRRHVVVVKTGETVDDTAAAVRDDREPFYESAFDLGRTRIPIWIPLLLVVLLPMLQIGLLRIMIPDISAMPAAFGSVNTYSNDQGKLDYLVYTPPSYQQGTELPLLLLIHGCTQDPYKLEIASGMRAIADQNNFMVVYPQQNAASSPHRCWNWYDNRNQLRDSGEPSLLVGIVNQVEQNYSVDPSRIYVAGISSGGAMTSILASCYPDVFAAASVHSGMAYDASNSPVEAITAPLSGSQTDPNAAGENAYACGGAASQPIPVLIFHGTADMIVVSENANDTLQQFAQTNDYADDDTDNDSVTAQPASREALQVTGGHTYTVEDYGSSDNLIMQRYIIDGLSHMWSGGTGTPPFSDPAAPNASQIMWDFFSAHPRS